MTQTTQKTALAAAITLGAFIALAGVAHAQTQIFDNTNIYGVVNGINGQPAFSIGSPTTITEVSTYHWNNSQGAQPGQISIRAANGAQIGIWQARGSSGQGGAQNVNWTINPNVTLQPGTYMVFDSSPNTWSSNQQSGGRGFTRVYGRAASVLSGGGGSGSGSGSGSGGGSSYSFTPCAANSNPVAVVGPCVAKRGQTLYVQAVRPGVTPAMLQFLANTPYSTAYNVVGILTPAGGNLYRWTVDARICGPGSAQPGFSYNVFLIDSLGRRQGQIGTFMPDCR